METGTIRRRSGHSQLRPQRLVADKGYTSAAFRNRREVGSLSGLTPNPHQSGESARERGISKAGNRPVRAMAIEIAWAWLRYQPNSQLSRWYEELFAHAGKRVRRIGIVALARRLLVALWQYLESGIPPHGAIQISA